jgi:CRISPR/Cas system-associated protein Csm6
MKSPLVDVTAILMFALLIVLVGQYYIHKKQNEVFQIPVKLMEEPVKPRVDMSKFQSAVKHTE